MTQYSQLSLIKLIICNSGSTQTLYCQVQYSGCWLCNMFSYPLDNEVDCNGIYRLRANSYVYCNYSGSATIVSAIAT